MGHGPTIYLNHCFLLHISAAAFVRHISAAPDFWHIPAANIITTRSIDFQTSRRSHAWRKSEHFDLAVEHTLPLNFLSSNAPFSRELHKANECNMIFGINNCAVEQHSVLVHYCIIYVFLNATTTTTTTWLQSCKSVQTI